MRPTLLRGDALALFRHPVLLLLTCFLWVLPRSSVAQPLAANKTKFVGNVIGDGLNIRTDFVKYWNQVTPENAGKWGSVETNQDAYSWTQLDAIYSFAMMLDFPYRHHCLVWGNQEPPFISTLDSANQYQEVEEWFIAVGQRYPNADYCDVVNEPLHAPPSYKNALGGDGATGWDWVIKAFELARLHLSPNTKLHLNEYSVINSYATNAQFRQIINLLKDRGLIDGIGVQGHGFEVDGGASMSTLQANLDSLAATGLPIYITEFDINQPDDSTQLARYQTIFPVLYEHPGVYGITLWGYAQWAIWKVDAYLVTERLAERPALQWLRTYLVSPFRPVLISPVWTTGEQRNTILVWHASDSATSYRIQVSANSTFASILVDSTVTDTLVQLDPLAANSRFYWRASASNANGTSMYSVAASFMTGDYVNGVEGAAQIPAAFELSQNYPNPFNPTTTIQFILPARSEVRLFLANTLGQIIAEIAGGTYDAGTHRVSFSASEIPSGVYFYRIVTSSGFSQTKKMVVLK